MPSTLTLPHIPVEQFALSNGLRVIFCQDHSVPVVSVAVYYDVGSRNERAGRTGFAHLFEHMMFQGSENVGKAEHFQYVFNSGGTMNGTTSTERTNYFETLPANQLPLALWLESDRMRSLKVTQENLDNQRSAVQEEKRLNYDNRPYTNAFVRLDEMIFKNPANAHSTIGSMEDLDAATVDDVQEFFRIYYAPNNAVLSIVGDFDPQEARALVEKYFATIPPQPAPPPVDVSEPPEVAVREETYYDKFAQLPAFLMGWKIPPRRTPDFYSLWLASDLLVEGESSRLYQNLVKGEESVVSIQGGIDERRGPSAFYIFAIPKPEKEMREIQQTIDAEIKQLAATGPTAEEMEKLHNNLLNGAARFLQSSQLRAQRLAEYALYDLDPNLVNAELDSYLKVTRSEIKEAAARYLNADNRSVINILPTREESGSSVISAAPFEGIQPPGAAEQPSAPPPQVPANTTGQEPAASIAKQPPSIDPRQTDPGA